MAKAPKGDELVKYITERVVVYMETPKEVRKQNKQSKEPWVLRWFGYAPYSILQWFQMNFKSEAVQKEAPPSSKV
ncbi:hypothetical protein BVG16_02270 [Paenibacillus selenitireducens]|uniref:YqzE family protein n=1 Tax=Paenibacillus selenitireducens TaxID=1324314 RepID=A0A1T2XN64_9BACL|nr:YqzE family protein [Paenibacillus selenitireducens]OPA81176.1 hypothetical protein BVG16_02270 [Paenibacillus selenitireducens]